MRHGEFEIEATVRKGCKRLILRCRDGKLYLSLPPRTPRRTVEAFLTAHEGWMREALLRHPRQEETLQPARLQAEIARLLPLWEKRMGVKCTGIRYRSMVSRWGSCQPKTGMITLNLRLSVKSEACMEYVLVHELCHLLHADHSPAFYGAMDGFLPDWRARKMLLNGRKPPGIS